MAGHRGRSQNSIGGSIARSGAPVRAAKVVADGGLDTSDLPPTYPQCLEPPDLTLGVVLDARLSRVTQLAALTAAERTVRLDEPDQ